MQAQPTQTSEGRPRAVTVALAALLIAWLAFAAHVTFHFGGRAPPHFWRPWVYDGIIGAAALLCTVRACVGEERLAWGAIGLSLALTWLGDLYSNNFLHGLEHRPYPSPTDVAWIASYLPLYAGIILLLRSRLPRLPVSVWLEGIVGGLAFGSAAAAFVFDPLVASTHGSAAEVITNLANPTCDVLLLAFVTCGFVILGRRAGRALMLLGVGLGILSVADSLFLWEVAKGTYREGAWLDAS
jgi:hypothetical protein